MTDLGLITAEEAAKMLRIAPSTVGQLRRDGKLPSIKLGKKYFYTKDALVKLINDQQNILTSEGEQ
jgi:excisionase family DNA binding protein